MKIEEVPQDKKYLEEGRVSDLAYALDEKGNYTSRKSLGWTPKNEALSLAWEVVYEKAEEARKGIMEGKLSPIAFWMALNVMDVRILADYIGLARWRVKRHLKMKNFNRISNELKERYAKALNLSPSDLTDIERIREMRLGHED